MYKGKIDFLAATGLQTQTAIRPAAQHTAVITFNSLPASSTCKTQLQNEGSALQSSVVFATKPTETPVRFPWFRQILHFLRS
jgi:hypothetical protein